MQDPHVLGSCVEFKQCEIGVGAVVRGLGCGCDLGTAETVRWCRVFWTTTDMLRHGWPSLVSDIADVSSQTAFTKCVDKHGDVVFWTRCTILNEKRSMWSFVLNLPVEMERASEWVELTRIEFCSNVGCAGAILSLWTEWCSHRRITWSCTGSPLCEVPFAALSFVFTLRCSQPAVYFEGREKG